MVGFTFKTVAPDLELSVTFVFSIFTSMATYINLKI